MDYPKEQLQLGWFLDHEKDKTIFRSIHVDGNDIILFFLMVEYYSIVYMLHIFMHSSVDGFRLLSCAGYCK